jgi:L-alanine-DL-glutamate epimerase-like enolase superfamily enzyme
VASAAALHLAASLPNFFIQEVPAVLDNAARQFRDELAGAPVESVKDGYFALSLQPGLGLKVNESLVRRDAQ